MRINGREVNNVADYAADSPYIVAREVDGELWFWDGFSDEVKANRAAWELGGVVLYNKVVTESE